MTLSVSYVKLTTKNSKGAQYLLNAGDLAYMLLEEFRCWLGLRHQHAELCPLGHRGIYRARFRVLHLRLIHGASVGQLTFDAALTEEVSV